MARIIQRDKQPSENADPTRQLALRIAPAIVDNPVRVPNIKQLNLRRAKKDS